MDTTAQTEEFASIMEQVIPPLNFAMVAPGIYRSGYPNSTNHSFLKALKLRTLIYLCPEDCNADNAEFCKENNITILQFGIQGNKEPFTDIPEPVRFYPSFSRTSPKDDVEVLTHKSVLI